MAVASKETTNRIGKYRILCHLKSGGMGSVYKAQDPIGRLVAVKVLSADSLDNPKRLERFRREAQQGARLRHENLVTLYDSGEDHGTFYMALEFVEGIDADELLRRHGLFSPYEACTIVTQVANALDYVHRAGVVHRDVKPSNILIMHRRGACVAKLGDLGLARGGLEDESRVTTDGTTVGTVDYMPPEQARDSGLADARSDLYALGCTLYHMLSGAPPFAEGSIVERLTKHAIAEAADLRKINPEVPDQLWAVCRRLLAKRPAERYQTAADLLADLAQVAPLLSRTQRIEPLAQPQLLRGAAATADNAASRRSSTSEVRRIADGQFEHATRARAAGNHDYGMTLLLNCCRLEPNNLAFHQALRQAQLARRDTPGVGPWCSTPKRWTLKLLLKVVKQLRQPLRVLICAEQLLICDPNDLAVQLDMARAARAAGFAELAHWLLETAQANHPDHADVTRELAVALEERGEIHRAFELWETIADADASDCEAHKKVRDLAANELTGKYRASRKETRLARRTRLDPSQKREA